VIDPAAPPRPVVLVADDDEDILTLVAFRLERSGCAVVKARSGDEALRLATELAPDLAVLDGMMPGLDGYEVTRRLRATEHTREMPIILLTARAEEADVARGMAAGADEYVKKPFDARDLRERVERLLRPGLTS
jgi:DNA-binding response OmpR family regulator